MNEVLGLFQRTHRPGAEQLSAYLDGRLDVAAAARIEAHVTACDACRNRLAELRATRDVLRSLPETEPPRSFRLRQSDVEAPLRARPAPPMVRAMPMLGAAAVVVFVAVVGVDLSRSDGASQSTASLKAGQPMAAAARTTQASGPADLTSGGAQGDAAAPPADANSDRSTTSGEAGTGVDTTAPDPAVGLNPPLPEIPGSLPPTPLAEGQLAAAPAANTTPDPSAPSKEAASDVEAPSTGAALNPPAATPPAEGQLAAAPATPAFRAAADRSAAEASGSGTDTAYRIAEALSAAVALLALGTVMIWRVRRREV